MSNVAVEETKNSNLLLEGIKSGYFQVTDSGSLSLDLRKFLESEEGKKRFVDIISSMPKVHKK